MDGPDFLNNHTDLGPNYSNEKGGRNLGEGPEGSDPGSDCTLTWYHQRMPGAYCLPISPKMESYLPIFLSLVDHSKICFILCEGSDRQKAKLRNENIMLS